MRKDDIGFRHITFFVIVFILTIGFSLCCWKAERYLNYHFGYESQVKAQMEPLEKRVKKLEDDWSSFDKMGVSP